MATVKLVDKTRSGTLTRDGLRFVNVYRVSDLVGTDAEQADEALLASGVPALGAAFSATRTSVVCSNLQATQLSGTPSAFSVTATYEDATDESDDSRLALGGVPRTYGGTTQLTTSHDKNGAIMRVLYEGLMSNVFPESAAYTLLDVLVSYNSVVEAQAEVPTVIIELTRRETSLANILTYQRTYQGRTNSVIWNGNGSGSVSWAARTMKCLDIAADAVNENEWRVRYRFEHVPETFDVVAFPRIQGQIPTDASAQTFEVLSSADFNSLPAYV